MNGEREHLAAALKAATDRLPLITRGIINAMHSAKPLAWRRLELDIAIGQARALSDELMLQRTKLGWHERGDAAVEQRAHLHDDERVPNPKGDAAC